MASSQGQQTSQSPFKLLSRVSWTIGSKKPKQGKLGDENNMYYHPELKRWVERGKEEEAEREAAGPPPPPVLSSGSITSGAPLHKRSLSQRYVLQPNLSVSSLASLAGSVSQTDLAGLLGALGDSFSGPPSALGSTAPSPPQSSNCLGSFTSGPPSATGLGSLSGGSFFVPAPPHRATSQPQGGFFVPPSSPEGRDRVGEEPRESTPLEDGGGTGERADAQANPSAVADDVEPPAGGTSFSNGTHDSTTAQPTTTPGKASGDAAPTSGANGAVCSDTDADLALDAGAQDHTAEDDAASASAQDHMAHGAVAAAQSLAIDGCAAGAGAEKADCASGVPHAASAPPPPLAAVQLAFPDAPAGPPVEQSYGDVLSFSDGLMPQQVDSPVALTSPAVAQQPPLMAWGVRRLGSGGVINPSDGGAAISLHEGMGFLPAVQPHAACEGVVEGGNGDTAGAAEAEVAAGQAEAVGAEGVVQVGETEVQSPAAEAVAQQLTGSGAVEAADNVAIATTEGAPEASSSTLYSQYYYQQYAYLYQYAVQQGYGEADAVAYAQYYAATYAQQYEAQAPQGLVGSGVTGGESEAEVATEPLEVAEAGTPGQQPTGDGGSQAAGGAGAAEAMMVPVSEPAVQPDGPTWQAVAEEVEDEASALVRAGSAARGLEGGLEEATPAEDPVYHTAEPSAAAADENGAPRALQRVAEAETDAGVGPQVMEVEASSAPFSAAPLPADLTAAATAAAQHHQSAVTAAVAAAAAAAAAAATLVEDQRPALGQQARGEHPTAWAMEAVPGQGASAAVGSQVVLGLGLAGAKRLTQLSSAATAAVASLGATVAATAPVAAALSAASAAAAAAASMRLDGAGLSEDDFERIMHPGDPAKLDGPLPWELPDNLRTGRKFLAVCSNWQLANPGLPYAPHLLLEQQQQQAEGTPAVEAGRQQQEVEGAAVLTKGSSDVALAAEGGSGSGGGAVTADQQLRQPQQSPVVEVLSSYERACRLAQFGQPVAGLALHQQVATEMQQQQQAAAKAPAVSAVPTTDVVASSCTTEKPQQQQPSVADAAPLTVPTAPAAVSVAIALVPQALDLGSLPAMDSPTVARHEQPTPDSARSEDPFAGAEHVSLAEQMRQQPSPLASPVRVPYDGAALTEEQVQPAAASFAPLGSVEAASFFEHLCDEAAVPSEPAAVQSEVAAVAPEASAIQQPFEAPATGAGEQAVGPAADDTAAVPAATLAAAAIDSVVQALEQLRCKAATANADDGPAAASPDSTSLLLQIHSSLAQATQALAGLGVDVSALASLAGAAQEHAPDVVAAEWTPGPGSKRPRMDASPSTPTRQVPTAAENVVTPVLQPGPPPMRVAAVEVGGEEGPAAGATTGPGERFQQLGRRLSDASAEAAAAGATLAAAKVSAADAAALPAQQPAVVLSLTVAAPPEVDVAAVEERVRREEQAGWEARLVAVVDSEREGAALVIAMVEQERDGLQRRVGELEEQLVAVTAERDGLAQRLVEAEAGSQQALAAARVEAEAERGVLAAQLSSALAEREGLAAQLASERSEKATLSEAVSAARAEGEELRRHYAERFASLTSELEATRGSLTELQAEHDELLLCLGQESTKVATLVDALREAGCDPDPMMERIEAEYETMGLGDGGQE